MTTAQHPLALAAHEAGMRGDLNRAEGLWKDLLAKEPRNSEAQIGLATIARSRGDLNGAADILVEAFRHHRDDPVIPMILAEVHRDANSMEGALEAAQVALALDPYCWPALLVRGQVEERLGRKREAASIFANVLRIAPPQPHWPPAYVHALGHAKTVTLEHQRSFRAHLEAAIGERAGDGRWREAASIMSGATQPYHAACNQLTVPRLPAIPFFERALFPWVAALEAQTDVIREELRAALQGEKDHFTPYIAYQPGDPVNQWKELNHSHRWSTYQLWRGGERVEEHLARCPRTAAALAAVEMADIGGLCPNAMFSALAPHTEIPPHHGETNARLVVHLPLIVPENCTYRVGFEERRWTVGEVLIFDDTLEHTARNDSDELRVVLIFDVWNPLLSVEERQIVRDLAAAARTFEGV
jgi:aspartate beta-hydroxylase